MSYENPRIKSLDMSMMDIMLSLAEGNPGAIVALASCVKAAPTVDPDSALGPLGPLCGLDNLDCYGSRIWMFYKDVCECYVHKMLGVMRAMQMGFVSNEKVNAAISGDRAAIDIPALLDKLKKRLPDFQTGAPEGLQ